MNQVISELYKLTDKFDIDEIQDKLIECNDMIDAFRSLISKIHEEIRLQEKEYTVGYAKGSNKIYCGIITENGLLSKDSQDRTKEIILAIISYLQDNGSGIYLNSPEGIPKFKLTVEAI